MGNIGWSSGRSKVPSRLWFLSWCGSCLELSGSWVRLAYWRGGTNVSSFAEAERLRSNFQGSLLSPSRKNVLICPRSGVSLILVFSSLSHLTTLYLSLSCTVTPDTSRYQDTHTTAAMDSLIDFASTNWSYYTVRYSLRANDRKTLRCEETASWGARTSTNTCPTDPRGVHAVHGPPRLCHQPGRQELRRREVSSPLSPPDGSCPRPLTD